MWTTQRRKAMIYVDEKKRDQPKDGNFLIHLLCVTVATVAAVAAAALHSND